MKDREGCRSVSDQEGIENSKTNARWYRNIGMTLCVLALVYAALQSAETFDPFSWENLPLALMTIAYFARASEGWNLKKVIRLME